MKISNISGKQIKIAIHDGFNVEPIGTIVINNGESGELSDVATHLSIMEVR